METIIVCVVTQIALLIGLPDIRWHYQADPSNNIWQFLLRQNMIRDMAVEYDIQW